MLHVFHVSSSPFVFEAHRPLPKRNQIVVLGVGIGVCAPDGISLDLTSQTAFGSFIEHAAFLASGSSPHLTFVPLRGVHELQSRINLAVDCCTAPISTLFFVCADPATRDEVLRVFSAQLFVPDRAQ